MGICHIGIRKRVQVVAAAAVAVAVSAMVLVAAAAAETFREHSAGGNAAVRDTGYTPAV